MSSKWAFREFQCELPVSRLWAQIPHWVPLRDNLQEMVSAILWIHQDHEDTNSCDLFLWLMPSLTRQDSPNDAESKSFYGFAYTNSNHLLPTEVLHRSLENPLLFPNITMMTVFVNIIQKYCSSTTPLSESFVSVTNAKQFMTQGTLK